MSSWGHYLWAVRREVGDPLAKALLVFIAQDTNEIGYRRQCPNRSTLQQVRHYFAMLELSDKDGLKLVDYLLDGGHLIDAFGLVPALEEAIPPTRGPIISARNRRIFERDGWKCVYCEAISDLTVDHKNPKSRGGSDDDSNLCTACRKCNATKGARTQEEWKPSIYVGDVV